MCALETAPGAITEQRGGSQEASSRRREGGEEKREDTGPGRLWVGAPPVGHTVTMRGGGQGKWRRREWAGPARGS